MPRFGRFSASLDRLGASSFGKAPSLGGGSPARLHIGDSYSPPEAGLDLPPDFLARHPHWFRYPNTTGQGRLREAIADFYATHHGLPTERENVLVSLGATGALQGILQLLVDPGDDVIVTTPAWPLILGMVRLSPARLVQCELFTHAREWSAERVESALETCVTDRTSVLYVNSPNNPSGRLLDDTQREAVLRFARRHDLWVVSDEAYDGMAYDGRATPPLALLDAERVITASTFSKIHRAAGLRLGWARATPATIAALDRVLTHQAYSASSLSQSLMLEPMRTRSEWAPAVLSEFQHQRDAFVERLGLPIDAPEGTYFCFLDLEALGAGPTDEVIRRCAERGVGVTPGREFGAGFERWIRVCFASESGETVARAADVLREVITAGRS